VGVLGKHSAIRPEQSYLHEEDEIEKLWWECGGKPALRHIPMTVGGLVVNEACTADHRMAEA
jgi:hypothetical protein